MVIGNDLVTISNLVEYKELTLYVGGFSVSSFPQYNPDIDCGCGFNNPTQYKILIGLYFNDNTANVNYKSLGTSVSGTTQAYLFGKK